MTASKATLDFTNVKEGSGFSKTHVAPGDYLAKVTKVQDAKAKDTGDPMWLFTLALKSQPSATYPYYCKLNQENQLWKVRNLLVAAGLNVPKKRVGVDPNKLVGKTVAVSIGEEEYNDKMQGTIDSIFPPSELEGDEDEGNDTPDASDEEETEEVGDDSEEEVEEEPAPKPVAKKAAPKQEVTDEDLEELEIEEI